MKDSADDALTTMRDTPREEPKSKAVHFGSALPVS